MTTADDGKFCGRYCEMKSSRKKDSKNATTRGGAGFGNNRRAERA